MMDGKNLYIIWNRYHYTPGSNIYLVSENEFSQFKADLKYGVGLHVNEWIATAEQGSTIHMIATSDTPFNTFEVMEEVKTWMANAGTESALDKVKSTKAFQGETMHCVMCHKKQQHVVGVESNWTLLQVEGDDYYVCPPCLQDHPQVKKTGNFARQYRHVISRIMKLRERLN
jgi:hypothetical protein